jgi:hypothetical protein
MLRYEPEPTPGEKTDTCSGEAKPVADARIRRVEAMFASRTRFHAAIPKVPFAEKTADDEDRAAQPDDEDADDPVHKLVARDNADDMTTYLSAHMRWYIEYPHVDDAFIAVYHSLPGYKILDPY